MFCLFFLFKQKTAYEMRISDWSSDVCSSDLTLQVLVPRKPGEALAAQPATTPRITTLADASGANVINPIVAEDAPGAGSPAEADTPAPRTHVVARGDSIWRLAEHYGVSRADLLERNDLSATNVLHPGMVAEDDAAPAAGPAAVSPAAVPAKDHCPNNK